MSNQLVPPNGQKNPFVAHGEAQALSPFLSFDHGHFYLGQDKVEVPIGTKFIADMDNYETGLKRWWGGSVTDRHMGRVLEHYQPPSGVTLRDQDESKWERDQNGNPRNPWQESRELPLYGEDGKMCMFASSSSGGRRRLGELSTNYGKAPEMQAGMLPIVELGSAQKTYSNPRRVVQEPVFSIVGWAPRQPASNGAPAPQPPLEGAAAAAIEHKRQEDAGSGQPANAGNAPRQPQPADINDEIPW